jgi:acyl carrier protein
MEGNVSVGIGRDMTEEEKVKLSERVRQFLAEELERDISEIRDDAHLIDDLELDSLLFLALFEELEAEYEVRVDTRKLAKIGRQNPIETLGELNDLIVRILEGKVALE